MDKPIVRILVVDDYEAWRVFTASALQKQPELQVIGEATNGLDAVQIAQQLQPDLILMDVGLPKLNGLEAARQIREICPQSKILFLSENRSPDIAQAALAGGARAYVVKLFAANELLPAVAAVLEGKQFVSASLTGPAAIDTDNKHTESLQPQDGELHEVRFHTDDAALVDDFACFLGPALKSGNAVVVIATESHRAGLLRRLESDGLDIAAAEQDRYMAFDVADSIAMVADHGRLDPILSKTAGRHPLRQAVKAVTEKGLHVAVG